MSKTIFIAAGEVSGDMHGAALAKALRRQDPDVILKGMGGHRMREAGVHLVADITKYSTIGFLEPLRFLPQILGTFFVLKTWIMRHRPTAIVLIDNQGFNMLVAKIACRVGIPTCYYIAPQEWQWGSESGGRQVAGLVTKILAILKPEYDFYKKIGANVTYVGHPILDTATPTLSRDEFCAQHGLDPAKPILAVFPGSRRQELVYMAPELFRATKLVMDQRPDLQLVVSVAAPHLQETVKTLCSAAGLTPIFCQDNINLIANSYLSLVTSGTISFEHAVLGIPCVVCYKFAPFSYWFLTTLFAKRVARIKFMSMANLIADREILPEFLQHKASAEAISAKALDLLAPHSAGYAQIKADLAELKQVVGEKGVLDRAAAEVLSLQL